MAKALRAYAFLLLPMLLSTSCREARPQPASTAPYVPLANVSAGFGELITVGNHPTPDQHGTGERIGLFRASDGTIWGLPLILDQSGAILVCSAPELAHAAVTDVLPRDATRILGATNEPTGWRGGTGRLEIAIQLADGSVRWRAVRSAETTAAAACRAPVSPGPPQHLHYYRLAREK